MKSVFFRNDDLGWMFPKFERLLALFQKHEAKLCAAAIPMSCLEQVACGSYQQFAGTLEVHTHGLTHLDFEGSGKRAEFGSARSITSATRDFQRAIEITEQIFGSLASPIFTPPWNRIDERLIPALKDCGFHALSVDGPNRFGGQILKELNVQVDLHTNKPQAPNSDEILKLVERANEPVGIMLHHKYMTDESFTELDALLTAFKEREIKSVFMKELLT